MSRFAKHNPVAKGTRFEPAAGRYVLYVGKGCPFAHRAHLALSVKGLQDAIQIVTVHPAKQRTRPDISYDQHMGWAFKPEDGEPFKNQNGYGSYDHEDVQVDPIKGFKTIREIYDHSGAPAGTVYSVPVFFDKQEDTIVSVESGDLMRVFNNDFNDFARKPELDLYPEALRSKIDELHEWMSSEVIFGLYKAGFAKNQEDYEKAFDTFFDGLDKIEAILSESRYLVGDQLTEIDLKLFVALIRFDEAYSVIYKLNKKLIREYENIYNWLRDVYQFEGVAETVNIQHIKLIYFANSNDYAPFGVYPKGSNLIENLSKLHGRQNVGKN